MGAEVGRIALYLLLRFAEFALFEVAYAAHEGGGDDTGGEGDHGDTDECGEGAEGASEHGDGVEVAVADGGVGDDGPPESVADVAEVVGLGITLDVVHEYGADEDDAGHDEEGEEEFPLDVVEDVDDHIEGVGVAGNFEDEEESAEFDEVEGHDACGEEGSDEGEDGGKVDDTVEGVEVAKAGLSVARMGVVEGGGGDAEGVVDGEDESGKEGEGEHVDVEVVEHAEGAQEHDGYGGEDDEFEKEGVGAREEDGEAFLLAGRKLGGVHSGRW